MAAIAFPSRIVDAFKAVSKQGDRYDVEDSPSHRYIGFLAEIEEAQYKSAGPVTHSLQFEIVPFEWMEAAVPEGSGTLRSRPPTSPTTLLVFDEAPLEDLTAALGTTPEEVGEGQWFIIELGRGKAAKRKRMEFESGVESVEASGRPVKRRRTEELQQRYLPWAHWIVDQIRQLLGGLSPREVGVMDVGQGSCNLVYDDQGQPLLYVDVGLPMFFNFASMPPLDGAGNVAIINPGPCLAHNPPGIVTHFHWDHYYMMSFSHNAAALKNRHWVMPQQNAGPLINGIIGQINASANGQVHVFPAGMGIFPANLVTILPCVPVGGIAAHDLNNTGIAVVVRIDDGLQRDVLLPGDAAFQTFGAIYGYATLRWMVATHHGSDRNMVPPPPPDVANQGRLAYSYGINGPAAGGQHCYGHPRPAAVMAYPAAGWGTVAGTTVQSTAETGPNSGVAGRGNILMANNVIPPLCGVANCPFHVFPKISV